MKITFSILSKNKTTELGFAKKKRLTAYYQRNVRLKLIDWAGKRIMIHTRVYAPRNNYYEFDVKLNCLSKAIIVERAFCYYGGTHRVLTPVLYHESKPLKHCPNNFIKHQTMHQLF